MTDPIAPLSRRKFVQQTVLIGSLLPVFPFTRLIKAEEYWSKSLSIHLFSKHLQFLNYEDMAAAAAAIGFDGIELAVREGGHVAPEQVEQQLPKAIKATQDAGLQATMMVTGITQADELSKRVLETAAQLGIKHYRLGYFYYPESGSLLDALQRFNEQMIQLAELNAQLGLIGSYQNHAGDLVGASMWEISKLLEETDPSAMGCQYDIRHATADGALSWENGLRLIKDQIHTIVLKDFKWEKIAGEWDLMNTPIGSGMVDFNTYFKTLKAYKLNVPVSLHYEYDLFGAEYGKKKIPKAHHSAIFSAMKKDLEHARQLWEKA